MNATHPPSRREFLSSNGKILAGTALASSALPCVHAAGDDTIRLALIGCGSRGSGAVADAMDSPHGSVKLVAMADLFEHRLASAFEVLSQKFGSRVDVPADRRFVGFNVNIHGTKRAAVLPWASGHRSEVQIYNDQRIAPDNVFWRAGSEGSGTHWQAEWNVLLEAIRKDKPHYEAKRAALTNLAAIMGRAAVHSGKVITWDEAMASDFQFCPHLESINENSLPPLQADAQGRYPVPVPGQWAEI